MLGLQHTHSVASAVLCLCTRCRVITEGGKLVSEAGRPEPLPAVFVLQAMAINVVKGPGTACPCRARSLTEWKWGECSAVDSLGLGVDRLEMLACSHPDATAKENWFKWLGSVRFDCFATQTLGWLEVSVAPRQGAGPRVLGPRCLQSNATERAPCRRHFSCTSKHPRVVEINPQSSAGASRCPELL